MGETEKFHAPSESPPTLDEHIVLPNEAAADVAVAGLAQSSMMGIIDRAAYRRSVDPNDLKQEVLIRALNQNRAGKLEMGPRLPGWISVVSNSIAIDTLRYGKTRWALETSLETEFGPDIDPAQAEAGFATVEQASIIEPILADLDPRDRAILELHYLKDMPIAQVAEALGASETTIKSRLSAALRWARKAAEKLDIDKGDALG